MYTITLVLLSLSLEIAIGQPVKVLLVFPVASSSHQILGSSLAKGLANRGHNVTLVAPFFDKNNEIENKNGRYSQIVIKEIAEQHQKDNFDFLSLEKKSMTYFISVWYKMLDNISNNVLKNTKLKNMYKQGHTFDVVIIEELYTDSIKVLHHIFNASLIMLSPFGPSHMVNDLVGNPGALAYIPESGSGLPTKMNFFNRVENVVRYCLSMGYTKIFLSKYQREYVKKYYPESPDLEVIKYNVSMVFLNSHVSTFQPVATVPSMISIGGYHVQPAKPLPEKLQNFLDNAKEGVIYFSMGSMLKGTNLPKEKINVIINTFKQLKQKVLWKWEDDKLPGKPDNVRIEKWLPQQDVLAHPNVKLFITHGGLLSTTEVIYHGKPVLAIPIFGDQFLNAQHMEDYGFALVHKFSDLTNTEEFLGKIKELLDNPKYYENAQQRSKIMHDQPMKPMDVAAFWVEHVARHKGAPHLRVAALDLPWYQLHLLDVIAFLIVTPIVVLYVFMLIICKLCCNKIRSKVKKQ